MAVVLLLPLASCANSGFGDSLQNSLAADPRLKETSPDGSLQSVNGTPSLAATSAQLPENFPSEIPRYPGAQLQVAKASGADSPLPGAQSTLTEWNTSDTSDRVLAFYKEQLQTGNWTLEPTPLTAPQGTLVARQKDLKVTVTVPNSTASPAPNPGTTFTLQYSRESASTAQSPTASISPSLSSSPAPTQLEVFLGVKGTSDGAIAQASPAPPPITSTPTPYTDLDKAPKELQQYLMDLAQLGVLSLSPSGDKTKAADTTFAPDKPVSRREYARWLFAANNRLYSDRAAQQIRSGQASQPAFRDVPPTDPDFAAIQGLAEAGIIPSSLSGDPTVVTFRPDAQLTREAMLLWKVPMDTRQPLPIANLDAIKQTWGFQDAARIEPSAQRAVLADFQNGDLSNIRRVFGYTTLFQPQKPVTRAEAAATLWYFGYQGNGVSARDALKGTK
ncbi:S-layer homology domain-containing protein [Leptodesmis sp.]|uniref:S-layer homology domain-containing protein n=1 Tax=Leptodesmis sp. TaxID=3100501 RepID=UPI0040535B7C